MPPTDPAPEPEEIETARKMCGEPSYALVEARVNTLSDAGWQAALADIEEYREVERKDVRLNGKVDIDNDRKRARLRREMRVRLGFDPRTDDERTQLPGTMSVYRSLRW
jgi:hypothetical protein